jgi:tRNA (guanine37-N1)-methyltransferase
VKSQGNIPVYYLSPKGKIFTQEMARELSKMERIALLCGHYEGIDERVYAVIDGEISIGDFILTGGELAAMVVIDAVTRLIDGVLSHPQSALEESFSDYLLEYPQYTRPEVFRGMRVPEVLLSGNHAEIARWRRQKSLEITLLKRPDLLKKANLTEEDKKFLREKGYEI